ncbi:MAG: DUF3365 domain-containing protein [Gammaproteobacteria bacterium]|nr:DUF3365 domain-containing protein [Gammaproteobacteria bacterium]HXK56809.1 DUF3365 domain-containing protein [Gammaproteobacteria bacterium]
MKRTILAVMISGLAFSSASAEQDRAADVAEAKTIINAFFEQLKGELQSSMKAGGPVNAIKSCQLKAPSIAHDISVSSGWRVGRTSLKLRNPANTPDAWELAVLKKFEERKSAGEDPQQIAYTEVVEHNGKSEFRFMKAIPTAELCLNCHGSELKPEVAAALDAHYTADQARGFKLGDIRGAFTLTKPLD